MILEFEASSLILKEQNGAEGRTRTADTWIFRPLLYQRTYFDSGLLARFIMQSDHNKTFLQIPKAELHLHLGGTMTPEVFAELVEKYRSRGEDHWKTSIRAANVGRHLALQKLVKHGIAPDQPSDLFGFSDFAGFLDLYAVMSNYMRESDDIARVARAAFKNLAAINVVYAEIEITLRDDVRSTHQTVEVLDELAKDAPLEVQWIAGLSRYQGGEGSLRTVENLLSAKPSNVVGITMGGEETAHGHAEHVPAYDLARSAGLGLSVHAGETAGADSVEQALKHLKVGRIGHGIRSVEDGGVLKRVVNEQVALEVCPTSNLLTGAAKSLKEHPIRQLFDAGALVTLNSDDPAFFGSDLFGEFSLLEQAGWNQSDLLRIAENGFRAAFLPDASKRTYLKRLNLIVKT